MLRKVTPNEVLKQTQEMPESLTSMQNSQVPFDWGAWVSSLEISNGHKVYVLTLVILGGQFLFKSLIFWL